jgi:hypothetical protein
MRIEWGLHNKSLTLTTGSHCGDELSVRFDKLTLALIEKQVCDIHLLKASMSKMIHAAERKSANLEEELVKASSKTFKGWLKRNFW